MNYKMNIGNALETAIQKLVSAGIDTPKLDAEVLLAHVLGRKRADLILERNDELNDRQIDEFYSFIKRRSKREPVSQIIEQREFWTQTIAVNNKVLTPRPETEGIVERAIQLFPKDAAIRILDIGTGSGCIAAALAHHFQNSSITATDISPEAMDIARKNLSFASARTATLIGDLFEALETNTSCDDSKHAFEHRASSIEHPSFDLIVSNPPYIPESDLATLPPEVRDHEPREALDGGTDGLAFLDQIIKDAPKYIKSSGWLILEIGFGQSDAVKNMIENAGPYTNIMMDKDLAGIDRIVSAQNTATRR